MAKTHLPELLTVLAADAVLYPDAMVSCDEADRQRALSVQSPCLVVEVLSASTAAFDLGAKFAAYRQVPVLQEHSHPGRALVRLGIDVDLVQGGNHGRSPREA